MRIPHDPARTIAAMASGDARTKTASVSVRRALSQGQPGGWASDHRAESERFTGWHYISIHTLGLQASKASVFVFDDSRYSDGDRRRLRSLRKSYKSSVGLEKAVELGKVGEPLPPDHPLVRLQSRPSPTQSGASFRYEQMQQLELTGRCYVWKLPGQVSGRTVERYVIPTAMLSPKPPAPGLPRGGYYLNPALASRYSGDKDGFIEGLSAISLALGKVIPAEQMQVIGWPHPLVKDDGYSPMSACALWTDLAELIDKARWGHLKRGPDPSVGVILSDDVEIENEAQLDRLVAKFEAKWGGADKAGGVFAGVGIKDIKAFVTTAKEMAYAESFPQMRDAILAIRGVTPIAAGLVDGGSYAAFYAALRGFVQLSVVPRLSLLAEEDTEQIARPEYGESLTVEIEPAGVDDPTLLQTQIQTAGSALLKDEVRDMLFGMTPMPNGMGQEPMGIAKETQPRAFGAPGAEETGVRQQPNYFSDRFDFSESSAGESQAVAGAPNALPENIASDDRLNGAQITAAKDVLADVSSGRAAPLVAVELLVALGLDRSRAESMVRAAESISPPPESAKRYRAGSGSWFDRVSRMALNGNGKH